MDISDKRKNVMMNNSLPRSRSILLVALCTFCILLITISMAAAAVSQVQVSPEDPVVGDEIIVSGMAAPDEKIDASVTFSNTVSPTDGEYTYIVGNVEIPSEGSNSFSVTGTPVKDMWISVKLYGLVPLTVSKDASGTTAKISQSNVPGGTHKITIGGLADSTSDVQLTIKATLGIEADPSGHFEYTYDTSAIPAGDFQLMVGGNSQTIALREPDSDSSSTPESSSGSSGGNNGGGGGSSGEANSIIDVVESNSYRMLAGTPVTFEFGEHDNPLVYINLTTKRTKYSVPVRIEVLSDTSTFVKTPVNGTIYRNLNIWIGYEGFATPANIQDASIVFGVEEQWLTEHGIDPSRIVLMHYDMDNDSWGPLSTKMINSDNTHIYYMANTLSFSPFAIIAIEEENVMDSDPETPISPTIPNGTDGTEDSGSEPSSVPTSNTLIMIFGLVAVTLLAGIIRRRR
ncbi:MAG: PGF-pre-PGF domain-containing protein [Euryarchaeota archaeon]|nr:PGF-pre-PGF domain-containing protein [Euryarchaeota archaeon]